MFYDEDREPGREAEANDGRAGSPEIDNAAADVELLPLYFKEMGSTPLLEREDEVRLARDLTEARQKFARIVLGLPTECRTYVLNGEARQRRSKKLWSMAEIETSYDRLISFGKAHDDPTTAKQIQELKRVKRRLDESRDGLILANLRLVTHIVKKYGNQGMPFMDLIQEGNIGLMKAVEKFEHEKGYKFSTYAYWWIKQAVTRAIADKARTIRVPVHVGEKIKKIRRASRELSESLGREPTNKEIAKKIDLPIKSVDEILGAATDPH